MQKLSKLIYFFITICFFIWVDFYFSWLILKNLAQGSFTSNSLVNIVYVENTGAAFSLLENATTFLIVFSALALIFMVIYIFRNILSLKFKELFCLSILMAGICGNLIERIHLGFVRDYFDLAFIDFPVFNISDIFINIGVFAIILIILFTKKPIKLL